MSELFNVLFTYTVFGIMGFFIAKKIKQPSSVIHWVMLISLFLLLSFVGTQTRIISILQFTIYLNLSLVGLGIGILLRFFYRQFNPKSAAEVK
jgi:hypothetical protein